MTLKNLNKIFFLHSKNLTILFFVGLVIIGYIIHKDYGISLDEESTRFHGIVSLNYICEFLFPNQKFEFQINNLIPKLNNYEYREYGVFFEILTITIIEMILEIKNFSEIFYNRHFANHLLFIISVICFYFLCFNIFKNKLYSFLGATILYTSPRIFAQSFYNNKDLVFLSLFIFLIFFSIKFIKKPGYYNAFLLSLFSAIASNVRIIGIYVVILVTFFLIVQLLMKNKFDLKKINSLLILLFFNFIFLYILWPLLWEAPLDNIVYALKSFSKYPWGGYVYYLGNFYKSEFLPWHYFFVFLFATTPLLLSAIIILGMYQITARFIKRFINIDKNDSYKDIWRSEKEKIFLFIFITVITPLFLIYFFDSRIFNGWRHLYFLFPCLILIGAYFIDRMTLIYSKKKIAIIFTFILVIICINNLYNLIRLHPYQYIYFNSIFEKNANELFEIDYWGVSNKNSLEKIAKNNPRKDKIVIGVASFTDLYLSKKMLSAKLKSKIIISGQDYQNADFIFNNNISEINPKFDDKYFIPKTFEKHLSMKRGNILINEFYKKGDKLN